MAEDKPIPPDPQLPRNIRENYNPNSTQKSDRTYSDTGKNKDTGSSSSTTKKK